MASAASNVNPPTKTARRRNSTCSSGTSRSWTSRWWPASSVAAPAGLGAPPVSRASRCSNLACNAAGDRTFTRAAASSIASGNPSSRRQISATAGAVSAVNVRSGLTARARSTKSRTASEAVAASVGEAVSGAGSDSGGTGYSCSPERAQSDPAGDQDLRPGQAPSKSATAGAARRTCSKLSSTSNRRRSQKRSETRGERFVRGLAHAEHLAIAGATRAESASGPG